MIDKIFDDKDQSPLRFEDLHDALSEASEVMKFDIKTFDIVGYLILLAAGKRVNPKEIPYFNFLASNFSFRSVLKRMREDPKVPCAGETILDEILVSKK